MSLHLVAVRFDARDPRALGAFWAGVLGREIVEEPHGVLVPGHGTQIGLRFVEAATETSERNHLHLHLHVTSSSAEDQQRTVETALSLGGQRRGTKPLPRNRDIYLIDPGGNELCLMQPDDDYLAGCGPLGEVTCDGSRAAGHFWREVLGWSTVWDRDEQIAIQSPRGGTKIAWDAWPDSPRTGRERQRFDVEAPSPEAEVERLVGLGATLRGSGDDELILTDPDGSEFSLSRS